MSDQSQTITNEDEGKKKSIGEKVIDALTGKKEDETTDANDDDVKTAEEKEGEENTLSLEEQLNQARLEAVEAYKAQQAELERQKSLSPEELRAEEDAKKDAELEKLRHDIQMRDSKDAAVKELSEASFPVELADILDYTSEETAKESLANVKKVFADALEKGVKERLKGTTPTGLNTNSEAITDLSERKAKMQKIMGLKQN